MGRRSARKNGSFFLRRLDEVFSAKMRRWCSPREFNLRCVNGDFGGGEEEGGAGVQYTRVSSIRGQGENVYKLRTNFAAAHPREFNGRSILDLVLVLEDFLAPR
jgi:hypothetical protein